jgi:hypothetical protein
MTVPALAHAPAAMPAQRPRAWPAILALYLLAPLIPECLATYNTPPLIFLLNPLTFIFLPAFYGSSALLLREALYRRGCSWPRAILLGAAFGALNEGVVAFTWFMAAGVPGFLASYGRAFGVNWVWALMLTLFHIIYSMLIPIFLAERCFPRVAHVPWLGRKGTIAFALWLAFTLALALLGPIYRPLRAASLVWALLLIGVALALPARRARQSTAPRAGRPPRLWTLRALGFAATLLFFVALYVLPHLIPIPALTALLLLAGMALAGWLLRRWRRAPGWSDRHTLALVSGMLAFGIALSPTQIATGEPVLAALFLAFLIWLAIRTARLPAPAFDALA